METFWIVVAGLVFFAAVAFFVINRIRQGNATVDHAITATVTAVATDIDKAKAAVLPAGASSAGSVPPAVSAPIVVTTTTTTP